jgi:redox-sensitive bicupin YhaK (pirin superfamily)
MSVDVRRAADRFVTRAEGRTTWHSFSFGAHYDPRDVALGPLVAFNDELLPAGTGYADHRQGDAEIVTVVLSGALRHRDGSGRTTVLGPGEVQLLSAGSGVVHAEVADESARGTTRFVQAWLRPDEPGLAPTYAHGRADVGADWTVLAARDDAVLPLHVAGAALHAARLEPGRVLDLPAGDRLHVFLATGGARLAADQSYDLAASDAARLVDEGGALTGSAAGTLALVWSLP